MKKCGDCIHADACEHNPNIPLFNRANAAYCKCFKDRTNFVEVVRCKECKHWLKDVAGCTDSVGRCEWANYMVGAVGYCVYGESKDNENP